MIFNSKQQEYINKYGDGARVYFYLSSYGYAHSSICGMLGNIEAESNFNASSKVDDGGATAAGICQWRAGRFTKLKKYIKKNFDTDVWQDLEKQVAFLNYELNNGYSSIVKKFKKAKTSVEEATDLFMSDFERCANADTQLKIRTKNALKWDRQMNSASDAMVGLEVHADQLYGSSNYRYVVAEEKESQEKKIANSFYETYKNLSSYEVIKDGSIKKIAEGLSKNALKGGRDTKAIQGNVRGSKLPIASNFVEAPFVRVTINGIEFGTYHEGSYPNYISGIDVIKTNGSVNQYTINLVHQINANSDPNIIDGLISAVGYDIIYITYGDANGTIFNNDKALIVECDSSFDFVNCNITYTIKATSNVLLASNEKLTFPARRDKPSNVIRELVFGDKSYCLKQYFGGMQSELIVDSLNLIPTNDAEVEIPEYKDINAFSYLLKLVSLMKDVQYINDDEVSSTYYLTLDDDAEIFRITEIKSGVKNISVPFMYEVNVGYPDSPVYDFSVGTNFAWTIAYNNNIPSVKHLLNDNGYLESNRTMSLIKNTTKALEAQEKNWWSSVTSFPYSATLTVKGLNKTLMLMTYIKVNVLYYGQKRTSSGLYIVTGQEDKLSGSGFRSMLSLLKVAGDGEYINTDGRIIT